MFPLTFTHTGLVGMASGCVYLHILSWAHCGNDTDIPGMLLGRWYDRRLDAALMHTGGKRDFLAKPTESMRRMRMVNSTRESSPNKIPEGLPQYSRDDLATQADSIPARSGQLGKNATFLIAFVHVL